MLPRAPVAARAGAIAAALALCQCGGPNGGETLASSAQGIVNGEVVTTPDSPILFLNGPEGQCTATLVAPNLVLTARHCIAQMIEGPFTCTPEGDLVLNGSGGGQIGQEDTPNQLQFYTNARVVGGTAFSSTLPPSAVGSQIFSTGALSVCRDDLAFVVLSTAIAGIVPAAIRLDNPTTYGELVSAWGYGLTSVVNDPFALRVRHDADIVGIGPDSPTSTAQLAPVRSLRIGPDDITCNGDSGGPLLSEATGAVIGMASLGNEANFSMPTCTNGGTPDTTGPRLAAYAALAMQAFTAAGATPTLEPLSTPEAGPPAEAAAPAEAGQLMPESAPPDTTATYGAGGGGCSIGVDRSRRALPLGVIAMISLVAAGAVGRRRR